MPARSAGRRTGAAPRNGVADMPSVQLPALERDDRRGESAGPTREQERFILQALPRRHWPRPRLPPEEQEPWGPRDRAGLRRRDLRGGQPEDEHQQRDREPPRAALRSRYRKATLRCGTPADRITAPSVPNIIGNGMKKGASSAPHSAARQVMTHFVCAQNRDDREAIGEAALRSSAGAASSRTGPRRDPSTGSSAARRNPPREGRCEEGCR